MSKSGVIVINQIMVNSAVWLSLSGTAIKVYHLFRCKCIIAKKNHRSNKRSESIIDRIMNNGEIEFTYKEAEKQYGIARGRFLRAIDELIEKGFIDVAEPGGGIHKLKTLYAISERWRDYDTPLFRKMHRPERRFKCGFHKGNKLWLKAREKKSTAIRAHGGASAMLKNAHSEILAMRTDAHGQKVINRYNYCDGRYLCTQIA
jgi:DNA-binding PadR family transcriptional regulator